MSEVFDKIKKSSAELSKLDDQIVTYIQVINEGLGKIISTRISIPWARRQEAVASCQLAFGKCSGKRQLIVMYINDAEEGLIEASRETRAAAFIEGAIEALLRSAHEQLTTQIAQRDEALKRGQEILEAIVEASKVQPK